MRAALWTPDLDGSDPSALDPPPNPASRAGAVGAAGLVGVGATVKAGSVGLAGVGSSATAGVAKMLDHRRVGVRALDWKFSLEVRPLRVCLFSSRASADADAASDPLSGAGIGDSAESGRSGDSCWLVAEIGHLESEWMQWSDTCLQSHLSLAGASICQVDHGLDPGQPHLVNNLLVWGLGADSDDAAGLELKIDSDGHGEEHRFDVKCAALSVNLAPHPVSTCISTCRGCRLGRQPCLHCMHALLRKMREASSASIWR